MVAKEEKLDEFINIKWDPKGAKAKRDKSIKDGSGDFSWKNKKGEKPGIDLGLTKDVDIIKNPGQTVKQVTKDKVVTPTINKAKEIGSQVINKTIEGGKEAVKGAVKGLSLIHI